MGFRHVTGVDIKERAIALARLRAAEQGLCEETVRFRIVDSDHPVPGDDAYDLVILNAVLEHLTPGKRATILPVLWRALRPGGHLLIHETPNRLFPIDRHMTGLPGLPWMPLGVKRAYLRLVGELPPDGGMTELCRTGIHGSTIFEIRRALPRNEVEDRSAIQDPHGTELTVTGRPRGALEALSIRVLRAYLRLLEPLLTRIGLATTHLYPFLLVCLRKMPQAGGGN